MFMRSGGVSKPYSRMIFRYSPEAFIARLRRREARVFPLRERRIEFRWLRHVRVQHGERGAPRFATGGVQYQLAPWREFGLVLDAVGLARQCRLQPSGLDAHFAPVVRRRACGDCQQGSREEKAGHDLIIRLPHNFDP